MSRRTDAQRLAVLHDALRTGRALEIVRHSGLRYSDVSMAIGVSTPTAWQYLNGGIQRPRRSNALRLASLLEMLEAVQHV